MYFDCFSLSAKFNDMLLWLGKAKQMCNIFTKFEVYLHFWTV